MASVSRAPVIVEAALREVWAEVLGVEHVGPMDNFFDLGGDSIRVLRMLARARDVGVDLDIDRLGEFLEDATCAHLLELTAQAEPAPSGGTGSDLLAPDVTTIVLRPGDSATNVFVLLPTMHDLWAVRELSARVPEASIHVLVPVWSPSRPYVSMPALGASIAAAVRAVQPGGPYRVIGSCTAGQAAIEAAGHIGALELLALVDTRPPTSTSAPPSLIGLMPVGRGAWVDLGGLIPKLLWLDRVRALGRMSPDELMLHLWTAVSLHIGDLLKYLAEVGPEQWDDAYRERAARTFMTWLNYQIAYEAYEAPSRYAGRVHLVYGQGADAQCQDPAASAAEWERLTGCTYELDTFDEEHSSAIMTNDVLVRLIEGSLRSGAAAGGPLAAPLTGQG